MTSSELVGGIPRLTPSRDPPVAAVRTELLHESEHTRVSRVVFQSGTVIKKEVLGPDGQLRLRHEVEILERLGGAEGVVQRTAGATQCPGAILLADVGGVDLSERITPLDSGELAGFGRTAGAGLGEGTPPGLSTIIMHLLEKEPDDRYQSADGLAGLLDREIDTVRL